ncbi:hypothetical protein EV138_1918 [Kribbella voronezhensis]|uniref:Aromatic ring-opening dioxygenase LigA n=1 Tax=Kribbella voronezhensis TaxID=2512212 RepID=A0A4R7T8W8_9ACTN|nr:hypothetical protein [Kribbella voronezhensis]TDU88374.1 hypothetical protein EV138_1918 [Kribbella voronezhensis]
MRRKTFDALLTSAGLVLAIVLVAAGGLLLWAHNFVDNQVHSQLAAQKIFFPKAGSESLEDPAVKPYLSQYAGQQLVTGAQAEAYANHFIAVHIQEMAGGKTYSQLSQESQANPTDTKLAGQVQTVFRGETLRGLLLNAYAFGKMGQIALIAAITAFAAAGLLLVMSALGYAHLRRVPVEAEVMPKLTGAVPHTA